MARMIAAAFDRSRATIMILAFLMAAGAYSYVVIPKEATPDIKIPIFSVNVAYSGISAEDSVRLLVRPLERQLQSLDGLRRMTAIAGEGFANVRLEFTPGGDQQDALLDVRDAVDKARADLPPGAEEPVVSEVDLSLFPIVTVTISGPLSERALLVIARDLRDRVEALSGVLEAEIAGNRDDVTEILIDPLALESYRISFSEVAQVVSRNNQLVAAGALATGAGRIPVSVPGVIQDVDDVLNMAVLVRGGTVVRLSDIAMVRQTFKDPTGFARINGEPTIALEIRKTTGANIIDTVAAVKRLMEAERSNWPDNVSVNYLQNQAEDIETQLSDLQNSVVAAVLLVMLTIVLALGVRASILVAIAIPGSFLTGILVIYAIGFTLNIVVLFALILVIGMLVDGAIVVVELAERLMAEGLPRHEAFRRAATRMSLPVIASTATTLAVFAPLLFWPGTAGQFMRYLPATVLITLTASLLMALVFVPVLGGAGRKATAPGAQSASRRAEGAEATARRSFYERSLAHLVAQPSLALVGAGGVLVFMYLAYASFGRGVDFFPRVEPQFAQVQIQSHGNLSVWEADALVRRVERRLLDMPEVDVVYARTIGTIQARTSANLSEDVIGSIQLDLGDWRERRAASAIIQEVRAKLADIPGVAISVREQQRGPSGGLPVELQIASRDRERIIPALDQVRQLMIDVGGFVDVTDDRPLGGVQIDVRVNREEAARHGADIAAVGGAVQLLTGGVLLGTYRPDHTDEEVELRLRFPPSERSVAQLANLRVLTPRGLIPIANFVSLEPAPLTGLVRRVGGARVHTITADVAEGALASERIAALQRAIVAAKIDPQVSVVFRGQAEDQEEAARFLILAFVTAVFLMLLILVIQFNSLYQAFLVLSAIVFSTGGVLLGLLLRQEAFSLVMSGMGVIALAGIVVNNNIVLIDAYNELRREGADARQAAISAGAQRLRPVLLTALTTAIGLVPMAAGLTIDFFERDFYIGAPSTQYWIQLAATIIGGLTIATAVTLFFTPAMLAWRDRNARPAQAPEGGQSALAPPR
jgi:multidrug efflux pump